MEYTRYGESYATILRNVAKTSRLHHSNGDANVLEGAAQLYEAKGDLTNDEVAEYAKAKVEGRVAVLPENYDENERLCEAVHNAWWKERKRQGNTDHPDCVPYDMLTEASKAYDRVTVAALITALKGGTSDEQPCWAD